MKWGRKMSGENFKTGIENRTVDSIASFFKRIWKDSPDQMCHAKMIFGKDGTPVDYIFLDINPAFEKALGLSKEQVRGQRFTGLFSHHDPGWIRKCGDVVRTGQMLASVEHNPGPDLWHEVQVFALDCANEFITLYNNITDYKGAEMALAESEKKYRELVRLAPAGIFEIDFRSRRFTSVNDTMCRLTGYDRAELLDMSPFDLLNEPGQELFQTWIEQWLNGEEPARSVDYLIRTKDGRELGANMDVSFAVDKNGRPMGATVVSHDITERKRAEEFLLNSSRQLEELIYERTRKIEEAKQRVNNNNLEGIADAFYDLDYEYKFTYVSLNIEPLWNCKIEDLLGRDIREVFPNIVGAPMYAQYQSVMENKEPVHFTTKSAYTEIWMEVDVYPSQNGISVYFRDITNRKRIEAELEQARQQTTDILESISDAFYALDHACRFTYVNTAAEKLLGKTKEELIGTGVSEAFPTTSLVFLNNLHDVIQNNEPFHTEIFALPLQKWIEVSIYPYNIGVSVYFRDITERKLMGATLRESEALYRTLFENSEDGFVLVEPIFDEQGDSNDYRMLQGNPAWERQTGLKATDFIGKRIKEAMPDVEPVPLAVYAEIVRTGLTKHFECYNADSGRWYDQHAFLYREGQVGALFRDITVRKQAEEALKESEERQAFLLKLCDGLRPINDPVEIHNVVARAVMDFFGADRCHYCVIEDDQAIIRRDASSGDLLSVAGVYPLSSFPVYKSLIDAGRPIIIPDVKITDQVDEELKQLCIQLKVSSNLNIPVIKSGKSVGLLCITQASPCNWTAAQVDLAKDIAERIWATVERAQAEQALRASEEKFRGFVEAAGEGIVESDTEGRIFFVNEQMTHLLGYTQNELLGRIGLEFMAEDVVEQATEDREGLGNGNNVAREYKLRHKDGSIVWTLCKATPLYDASGQTRGSLAMHADITRRKQVEEEKQVLLNAIQMERDRLSALIHNIPDEVWFTDDRGNIIITNQATREEFGASYQGINAAEIAASLEIYRADGSPRPLAETPLLRAVNGEEIRNLVEIIRTPANNELRYRQFNAAPVHDIDGSIIGAVTITRDITEQKQAEKEYAMSRLDKISTLYINNGDLSAILDEILELAISFTGADMGTIQLLETESGVLRIMAQRGLEQPLLNFFAVVDRETGISGTALHRGERVIVEDVARSPIFAGTPARDVVLEAGVRAVQSTPLITRSGVLVGTISTHFRSPHMPEEQDLQLVDLLSQQAADLIERKKSEDVLRRSEEHFSMIFNNSPDMICIIDMETDRFVDINLRFTEVLGYTREEVIGRTLQELNYLTDSRQDEQKHKSGKFMSNETVLRSKSGKLINVLFSVEVAEIGRRKQKITIFKDITKEKMVEAEMARLDRLNLVGEMAAGIGHEVRNPMTTVKGFLQLLGEKDRCAKDKHYFALMVEELDRANSIISEFLSLARNKLIDLEVNNLNKIIKLILPLIQADGLVTDKYIKLETKEIPDLMLDEKEIRQLVLNLVRNGLQAMEPGKTLTLETFMEEDNVVLSVKDQGSGIPDEIVDKIGTPFFTTKDTGTGLGLAVCYSIAARHNARIDYLTGTEGTTFYVRFSSTAG